MADQADDKGSKAGKTLHERVAEVIDTIRPALQYDGGDVELIDVGDDGVVRVRLQGACMGCPSASVTLRMGIERHLKIQVPEVTRVVSA